MGKANIRDRASRPLAAPIPDYDAIIDRLKAEFMEFANNALDELDSLIEAGHAPNCDAEHIINAVRRSAHNLKGMGSSFGFPLITLLALRLEDYFIGRQVLDHEILSEAYSFINRMRETLEGRFDGVNEADVMRTLPAKIGH
ncbi:MAG: Hpt domain-containing protein [Alphaproteobacteria bacterium]|nr:Hpt domain-containing protein [Alphaproteobacteria bacterium]